MSYKNPIQHQKNRRQQLDLTSEGVILLVEDLLRSGFAVRIKVGGRSMGPFLNSDDIVTLKGRDSLRLRIGDIILFINDESGLVLHRIVRLKDVNENVVVQTKGDGLTGLVLLIHELPADLQKMRPLIEL